MSQNWNPDGFSSMPHAVSVLPGCQSSCDPPSKVEPHNTHRFCLDPGMMLQNRVPASCARMLEQVWGSRTDPMPFPWALIEAKSLWEFARVGYPSYLPSSAKPTANPVLSLAGWLAQTNLPFLFQMRRLLHGSFHEDPVHPLLRFPVWAIPRMGTQYHPVTGNACSQN